MKLSIVGFGKLGSGLTAAFVSRGFEVLALDVSSDALTIPLQHDYPEPQVSELLNDAKEIGALTLGTIETHQYGIADTHATFVIVPTPSRPDGSFDTSYCVAAMQTIGDAIKDKDAYHLVVLSSTVMPVACEGEIIPALEDAAGREIGDRLGFCYSPAFIAQGSVVHDFLNPDFVLIGGCDSVASFALGTIYDSLFGARMGYTRMSLPSAEITKLALNTFITTKISFANMLAALCHQTPGANVDDVTRAMGLDSRVSPRYFKGATGYGGPCFPRDGRAMMDALNRVSLRNGYAGMAFATIRVNQEHSEFVGEMAVNALCKGGAVVILGTTYKTGTPITEESFGLLVADYIRRVYGTEVVTLDPTQDSWSDFDALTRQADVIVVTLPYEQFKHLPYQSGQTIIDCWRIIDPKALPDGVKYVPLGVGQ